MISPGSRQTIRQTRGDGRWFPSHPGELRALVERCLDGAAPADLPGRLEAVVAPHAGYVYSGAIAGHAFRALRDDAARHGPPETIVILGFSHRSAVQGVALMDGEAVASPLGQTTLDRDAADAILQHDPAARYCYAPHDGEHSAENEIPFAQAAAPTARLVVALMGDHTPRVCERLARALLALSRQRRIVVVASTDMLHDPDYDFVRRTDRATLALLERLDATSLRAAWQPSHQPVCGLGPVCTTLAFAAARGCEAGTLLCYRNSGDDHPETRGEWVVGYASLAFASQEVALDRVQRA